ncbi:N-acetylneuraminate synthase [Metabacillus indicus]|uniref:N-acetylneuraminate synthase n=1 Tax=Metabacillus indicus TaxID=246786 RepID=UPI003CF73633
MLNLQNGAFIIAEIGVNHNGSLDMAKKLVDEAVRAGADAVKFQLFQADELTTRTVGLADYQKKTMEATQHEMLKKLELSYADFIELKKYCDNKNVFFMATPFDVKSVDILDEMGMKVFKVGSGDLTNFPLLKQISKKKKPIILSTGMALLEEIDRTISYLQSLNEKQEICILHCTSSYPAPEEELNLHVIKDYINRYPFTIGYSDHSVGTHIPVAAIAIGAKIIEKHFTLDQTLPGPDHSASMQAEEFKEMVRQIRLTETALGSDQKQLTNLETQVKPLVRRGLYLKRDLPAGTVVTELDLVALRPLEGIEANEYENVLGKVLKIFKKQHQPLSWDDFL